MNLNYNKNKNNVQAKQKPEKISLHINTVITKTQILRYQC